MDCIFNDAVVFCKADIERRGYEVVHGAFCRQYAQSFVGLADGVFRHSGLLDVIIMVCRGRNLPLRCRRALFAAFALFVVMCLIVFLLSFVPHAVLLGVSGSLYPSAFSASVVPVLTLMLVVISLAYAVVGGVYSSLSDIFRGLYVGVVVFATLFPLYVLVLQLYCSVCFVFML